MAFNPNLRAYQEEVSAKLIPFFQAVLADTSDDGMRTKYRRAAGGWQTDTFVQMLHQGLDPAAALARCERGDLAFTASHREQGLVP